MRTRATGLAALALALVVGRAAAAPPVETVVVDEAAPRRPFVHFWERIFGSGRAALSLRESYRRDLDAIQRVTDLGYVRFHAIFHDELGVYDEDPAGAPRYNFSYVDQIYDGLLARGVRPFVELSFMPRKLAAKPIEHEFWYRPIVSPPKSPERWEALVYEFTKHLVERYGADEVARWYFEVWNEPNIHFWVGEPKERTYYELYDRAARAVKRVDPRLRVGGPASAQAVWVDRFIKHCVEAKVPVDFVSTHVYANDSAEDVFGTHETITRREMVCRAAKKVHDQVKASARPGLPILFSEFNASYKNEPEITDRLMMGPWLADTVRRCDGLVDALAYWTFSDVFEEQGVVSEPFYGGFGAIAAGGIPKPAFNAFALLHRLGDERLANDSASALVTRRADGTLALALYNLALPGEPATTRRLRLELRGGAAARPARVSRIDDSHGSPLAAYAKMGRPRYPTAAQLAALKRAAELPPPESAAFENGALELTLAPNTLLLVEVR